MCLEGLIYLVLLKDTIGPFAFFGSVPSPAIDLTSPARVLIVASGEAPASERRLGRWERAAEAAGLGAERVPLERLVDAGSGRTVVVLPGVTSLDDPGRQALRRVLDQGGGVVASGALGSQDAQAGASGFDFLLQLTGAAAAETVAQGASSVTLSGGRYLSDSVPAGSRLELPAQDLVLLRAKSPDAYRTLGPPSGPTKSMQLHVTP